MSETLAARLDMCRVNAQPDVETDVVTDERRQRFDVLFREHVSGVGSYCRSRSRSRGDAEDAVAEVFLIAWRRLDDVPSGAHARPWLYATARRVLANQARAYVRRSRLAAELMAQRVPAEAEEPLAGRVHDALAALDPHDREILLLVEWEGLTPSEIASVLHRPAVTVRVRLHRARRRFRAMFEARTVDDAPHALVPSLPSGCES